MKHQAWNYLNRTWIVRTLKRYGIMNRTIEEMYSESKLKRILEEYNKIQLGRPKANRKARDLIVKEVRTLADLGIVNLKARPKPIMKVVKDV